jgi:hypothetical protein
LPFEAPDKAASKRASLSPSGSSVVPSHSLSLGLDTLGGTPTLSPAERRVLDAQRYAAADLRSAWESLGKEVKERGE